MPLAPWEEPAVLAQALATLAAQQPAPQRLVLSVDGPMPDCLQPVVQAQVLAGLSILVLPGPGGEGVGLVLARGLAACSCELILRADADDLSLPDRAARQLVWLAQHPEVIAGSAWMEEFFDQPEQVLGCRHVPVGAVVMRRSAVLAMGGYRDQPGFEDYDLWLRLLHRHGPTAVNNLPEVLVRARVGAAHLARRRGLTYARAEARFICRAAREGHMPRGQALLLLVLRLPWRLLPSPALARLMRLMRR
jgi:hypothetical protein